MTTLITRNVCLDPRFLNQNYMAHLLKKLEIATNEECSKEYGYILGITKITKVVGNYISPANSDIVFRLIFEATILKPEVGNTISGVVCMIFEDGIFVDIGGKLNILVPVSSLPGYELSSLLTHYSKGDKKIGVDDKIDVVIEAVKYDKKEFKCLGSLVDEFKD